MEGKWEVGDFICFPCGRGGGHLSKMATPSLDSEEGKERGEGREEASDRHDPHRSKRKGGSGLRAWAHDEGRSGPCVELGAALRTRIAKPKQADAERADVRWKGGREEGHRAGHRAAGHV